jgi:RimJ/RimL family protein N-acetyltransferase
LSSETTDIKSQLWDFHLETCSKYPDYVVQLDSPETLYTYYQEGNAVVKMGEVEGEIKPVGFAKIWTYVGSDGFSKVAEIGTLMVDDRFSGKGIAKDLILDCLNIIDNKYNDIDRVVAVCHVKNLGSIRLFTRLGGIVEESWPSYMRSTKTHTYKYCIDLTSLLK